jgi:acetyl esterase
MTTNWTEETIDLGPGLRVAARIYRTDRLQHAAPLVLHLHGGAFVGGSLEAGHTVSALLADAGATVVSPDYPLAPKHRFPQALDGSFGVLKWLYRGRTRWAGNRKSAIFVAGEEAGGNLAAGLSLMARDQQLVPLAGQILLSPMLDPRMATCSMRRAEAGHVGCKWADGWHDYLGSANKADHPYAAPMQSSRLAGLPRALIVTAEDDLLRDESLSYAQKLRSASVAVDQHVLAAPTGWPCALNAPPAPGTAWATALSNRFVDFFAQTLDLVRRPVSLNPVQA